MAQISQKIFETKPRKKSSALPKNGVVASAVAAGIPGAGSPGAGGAATKNPAVSAPGANGGSVQTQSPGFTLPDTTLRKPTSQYDFIKALYDAQQESALKALEAAYEQNVIDLNAEAETAAQQYRAARDQTAASAAVSRAGWNEYALASGLNNGAAGQAQLALGNQLTGDLGALQKAEADALRDIETRREKHTAQYRAEVAQAIADGNYKRANALYEEALRLDKALTELSEKQVDKNYRALSAAIELAKQYAALQKAQAKA